MTGKGVHVYKRVKSAICEKTNSAAKLQIDKNEALYGVCLFLLSRVPLFDGLAPFGFSLYSASCFRVNKRMLLGILLLVLGGFSGGVGIRVLQYAVGSILVTLYKYFFGREQYGFKKWMPVVAGISNVIGGLILIIWKQLFIYNLFLCIAESLLVLLVTSLFVNVNAISKFDYMRIRHIQREDMLGVILLLALAFSGLGDFLRFGAVDVSEIALNIIVLCFAMGSGVSGGLCAGTVVGLVAAMAESDPLNIIGFFCACGFAAGFANRTGKIGVAAAYLLTAVSMGASATLFVYGQLGILNILIAALAFVFLSEKINKHLNICADIFVPAEQKIQAERVNMLVNEKFNGLSTLFANLSDTIENLSKFKRNLYTLKTSGISAKVKENVCASCGMKVYCWEKEVQRTEKVMAQISDKIKGKGYIDMLDFDDAFRKSCPRTNQMADEINRVCAMQRINSIWDNQLNETRILLGNQYKEFADVMKTMADEVTSKVVSENGIENSIMHLLTKMGYNLLGVYLFERTDESYDVEIQFPEFAEDFSTIEVEKLVSDAIGQRMRMCIIDEYNYKVRLEPQNKFIINSSIATVKKDGEDENGDSYAVFNIRNNRCVLLLSDGMGSGRSASVESQSAVSLLKNLIMLGFDFDAAVQMVNSALVLKAGNESFATIDMVVIDLSTGVAEFIKIGASRSYIKSRKGVSVVRCAGLPLGILTDTTSVHQKFELNNDDCIVMVSDGICESNCRESVAGFIDDLSIDDPDEIAKQLLNFALQHRKKHADDDMTVIVAKIVESGELDFV